MKEKKFTFCRICEGACGLIAEVEDNKIISLSPNKDHVASRGFACKKGLKFHELEHSPDRLKFPMKRYGDKWERISWDQAIEEIGTKVKKLIQKDGKDSISIYVGSGAGFSLIHGFAAQGFMSGVGSINLFSASTQDCSNKFAIGQHMYGSPLLQTFPDVDNTNCFISIGANPAVSKLSFANTPYIIKRLKAIEERGGKIYHINPRKTETARVVGEQIFIRPGTDIFFLLAFANELIAIDGVDHKRVSAYMKNYEIFAEIVKPWTPEKVEKATCIKADTLRELVKSYKSYGKSCLYCSTGINQSKKAAASFWILEVINAISGNLDAIGGTIIGKGIIDLPGISKKQGALEGKETSRIGNFPSVMECFPGAILGDEIHTSGQGQIKAMFVSGGNIALSLPDSNRTVEALKKLELLVTIDLFKTETGNISHYMLPATTFMQKSDINFLFQSMMGIMSIPHLSYTDPVIGPEGEQKDEAWIYAKLARAAGLKFFGSRFMDILLGIGSFLSLLPVIGKKYRDPSQLIYNFMIKKGAKTSIKKMKNYPHGMLLEPHVENSFLGKRVLTEDGLIDLAPQPLVEDAESFNDHYNYEISIMNKIKIVNKRENLSHNTYFHNAPSVVGGKRNTNYIYMNAEDARARGIANNDLVKVTSASGSIKIPAIVNDEMMPGAAAIPHGWGHGKADGLKTARINAGVNVNILTPSGRESIDRISGMAHLTGIPVEIEKV